MRRREFITLLGGAAGAWPIAAGAQQAERMRRIGVLIAISERDAEAQRWVMAFQEGLEKLGWTVGRNVQIDYRWGMNDAEEARAGMTELLKLAPDVILTDGGAASRAAQQATRTIPIVFVLVGEPIAQGLVQSLAHPGANITGFANLEPTLGPKWLEMLKEIAPGVARACSKLARKEAGDSRWLSRVPSAPTSAEPGCVPPRASAAFPQHLPEKCASMPV
jgi:ABC-type uncharacterized transport system substrate-binding protein